MTQTDGPGFSLCAAPLELSGPGFHGIGQRLDECEGDAADEATMIDNSKTGANKR